MVDQWTTTATLALGCATLLHLVRIFIWNQNPHPLPPGPPGLPWVGNVIGIKTNTPWKTYAEWARTYGDIVYSRLLGRDIIIINSERIAKDLLGSRSRNYSDRPKFISVEKCGQDFNCASIPYGDLWRLHRRFFHQTFRLDMIPRFLPAQHRRACHFLRQLLVNPEQLDDHVFEYTASIILNVVYNYDPASRTDELLDIMAKVLGIISSALRPDVAVIVDAFPSLLRLPSWFPGMSFKKEMETARMFSKEYLKRPFEHSLENMLGSSPAPSMLYDALQIVKDREVAPAELQMKVIQEACGTAFVAASETSNSVLMTFIFMMMLNPAVQEKAHAQIDTVVGRSRLPTMDDRPMLPLLDAIFWETLRYCPVAPLSVPHAAMEDDVYNGFYIPKGALILTNLWAMARDELRYPNPQVFIPERFLNDDGSLKPNDVEHIAFGFGRRICPGRHFADTSVWNVIAKVLAVFKILKPLDENGVEVPVEEKFSSGLSVHPLPFRCRIVPRCSEMDVEKLEELISASSA